MRGWPVHRPTPTPAASARTQAQNAPILRYNPRMGKSRYSVLNHQAPHFVTCTAVKWRPLFADPGIVNILLNAIRYLQAENTLRLHGYVVMGNHLHMIVSGQDVSAAIISFKKFTARQIVEYLRENGRSGMLRELSFAMRKEGGSRQHQVWQPDFHPQAIAGEDMLRQKLDYMRANPVRRGYVDDPTCLAEFQRAQLRGNGRRVGSRDSGVARTPVADAVAVCFEGCCRSMCWPRERPATHAAAGAAARGVLVFGLGDSFAVGLGAVAGADA